MWLCGDLTAHLPGNHHRDQSDRLSRQSCAVCHACIDTHSDGSEVLSVVRGAPNGPVYTTQQHPETFSRACPG